MTRHVSMTFFVMPIVHDLDVRVLQKVMVLEELHDKRLEECLQIFNGAQLHRKHLPLRVQHLPID